MEAPVRKALNRVEPVNPIMAPEASSSNGNRPASEAQSNPAGPSQSSYIHLSNQYIFQPQLQSQLAANGSNLTREDNFRLLGIQWISDTRQALQLPVRTFCTAASYYHKFRLAHKFNEYQYHDAAAGALLTACKIEDTLKKSKEIICAAHNLKVSPSEHLSPDDSIFEGLSKIVIGLERLMLEASGFDFRVRYPQKHLVKIAKMIGLEKTVYLLGYDIMIDLYRTFAPLKQTSATMSFACLELATLILDMKVVSIRGAEANFLYEKCCTSRAEILETLLDLLDLYTHFQKSSIVGPLYHIDKFIHIRISVNQEMEQNPSLNRFTELHQSLEMNDPKKTLKPSNPPISPPENRRNGHANTSPMPMSPRPVDSEKRGAGAGARGQDGTVRFILDTEQAKKEQETISKYFKTEYEEYEIEIEVEEPVRIYRETRGNRGLSRGHDDRYSYYNSSKRARR
ncbi:hypothetical protein K3495_g5780 [Podosphaera aphanis]|nr:hypothetical protein K3495_g5780 [Podosphaera aphanis]